MSYRITEDVIRVDAHRAFIPQPLKAVLVALASYASNDTAEARPSVDTLARATGFQIRKVISSLHELVRLRLIVVVRRHRQHAPTVYRIDLERLAALPRTDDKRQECTSDTSEQECTSDTSGTETIASVTAQGCMPSGPEVHVTTSRGARQTPESVFESVSESKARRPLVAVRALD